MHGWLTSSHMSSLGAEAMNALHTMGEVRRSTSALCTLGSTPSTHDCPCSRGSSGLRDSKSRSTYTPPSTWSTKYLRDREEWGFGGEAQGA